MFLSRPIGTLYAARRRDVLDSVGEGLRAMGIGAEIDEEARELAATASDINLQVGFRTRRQLFGAHIHTLYRVEARKRDGSEGGGSLGFRWGVVGRRRFVARRGSDEEVHTLASRLNDDPAVADMLKRSGVKAIGIQKNDGWRILLEPIAGVISVIFFPPAPPFTVRLKRDEVREHVAVLRRIAAHIQAL